MGAAGSTTYPLGGAEAVVGSQPIMRILSVLGLVALSVSLDAQPALDTTHVVLVTLDGLRWQEVFTGAEEALVDHEDFVSDPEDLRERFWSADPMLRREKLLPFFWSVLATEGQLYGNRVEGSKVNVTNAHRFSYPGYNEILTGRADDRIDSNDKLENANVTVLEFLHRLPRFRNAVAAFASWDVFPYIINESRSGIPVNAGFRPATEDELTAREHFLNVLQTQTPSPWSTVRLDAFTHHYALEYMKKHQPRVVYIAYGETDDFAHDGEYDAYLQAAHRTDAFLRDLWSFIQSRAPYRNTTTLIVTTDHGRGTEPIDTWKSHGTDVPGSDQIWLAFIGPDTLPRGEIQTEGQLYQHQVASTLAAFLGVTYTSAEEVGAVIGEAIER